jgi:hypothetical protein
MRSRIRYKGRLKLGSSGRDGAKVAITNHFYSGLTAAVSCPFRTRTSSDLVDDFLSATLAFLLFLRVTHFFSSGRFPFDSLYRYIAQPDLGLDFLTHCLSLPIYFTTHIARSRNIIITSVAYLPC